MIEKGRIDRNPALLISGILDQGGSLATALFVDPGI